MLTFQHKKQDSSVNDLIMFRNIIPWQIPHFHRPVLFWKNYQKNTKIIDRIYHHG